MDNRPPLKILTSALPDDLSGGITMLLKNNHLTRLGYID